MNKFYLYVKKEDELGEVIEKIRGAKDKEIILVVPSGTKSLSHPVNLEILKKEIEDAQKNVYLSTDDEKISALARKFSIQLFLDDSEEYQIVDIKPPSFYQQERNHLIENKTLKEKKISHKKFNFFSLLKYFFIYITIFAFIFGVAFILWQFLQAKAEIEIGTEKEVVEINDMITLKDGQVNVDLENKIFPAKYIKLEISKTESVTTTGPFSASEKPLLEVSFLNFSEENIPLVAGTRVEYEGNIFRTTEKITLPAKTNNVPGQVNVSAVPDSIKNNELFIKVDTPLNIPGLEGKKRNDGQLWTDIIKAKTFKEYNLSSSSDVHSVAPEDITNVKLNLEKSLKENIAFKLNTEYPDYFFIYDPSLIKVEISNISHQVGVKTDKIYALGKATFETLIITKKDFDTFIKNIINKNILAQNKNLTIKTLKIDKEEILDFDSKKKILILGIKGIVSLETEINPEIIKKEIMGKTIEEVNAYFSQFSGIKKIKIKIFPQWQDKIPNDYKKIKIKII